MIGYLIGILVIVVVIVAMQSKNAPGGVYQGSSTYTGDNMNYNSEKKEIYVIKRGRVFLEALKIIDMEITVEAYAPEKQHFGAVTVGGVTTGGTYKTGGYTYAVGTAKTGKCALAYGKEEVQTIKLSPELAKKAKRSEIQKYVDGDGVIEIIRPTSSASLPDYFAYIKDVRTYKYALQKETVKQLYPTKEKCVAILNWLSQEQEQEQEEKQEQVEIATQSVSNNIGTPSVTPEEVAEMRRLYAELGSYAAVAKKIGRSSSTVAKYIKDRK